MQNLQQDPLNAANEHSTNKRQFEEYQDDSAEYSAQMTTDNRSMELAIIGMAGRFPGAPNIDKFWQNLANGVESIRFFTDEEVASAGVDPAIYKDPHYVKAGGYLDDVEVFDAGFFNIYPREAAIMDPQHRVFLEVAWETLENAGYNPEDYPGWIGLFAGMGMNTYLMFNLIPNREIMENVHGYQLTISSDKDFLPTRVSYKLNLRGPSINVQTACSTSLVAVHLACQSLLSYQCDMALAGGVSIRLPQKTGYMYQEGGITSPDGHCRAFDARAAGTVSGNGVGAVLIKRLNDAIRDGDTIRAIIKGSAINNDGSLKVGYTAPSIDGQVEVISMAQAVANVNPETISYVETHGTGTALGDPIEIAALTQVFRSGSQEELPPGSCAIGSVKTNVGHLDAAAGVTSLIKATLALENRQIPPSLHYTRPNPKIDFENSPFYVNTQLTPWETNGFPRRAGVSSFGIGGTNVHLILEEAASLEVENLVRRPSADEIGLDGNHPWQLLLLSARSPAALEKLTDNLAATLKAHPEISLPDVAYTLQIGRKAFAYRRMLVCNNVLDTVQALENRDPQRLVSGRPRENTGRSSGNSSAIRAMEYSRPQVVFMFSGQGAQYVGMGRGLYEHEPVFRDEVDLCAEILIKHLGHDIRTTIFETEAGGWLSKSNPTDEADLSVPGQAASKDLMQTSLTQPALFVIEYALAKLLIHWGIEPEAMIGHSIGEYVAGCLAGVFTLEDALALVAARGRLMQRVAPGAMVSIPLSEAEIQAYLGPGLSLAAVNAPSLCVVSGDFEHIDALTYRLANDAIEYRRLRTSHAFHSEMMDEILEEFFQHLRALELKPPKIPFISNVSGTWIKPEQATDPLYWVRHLRQTVRFGQGISELLQDPAWTLLEVGPGQTLVQLARSVLAAWAASEGRPVDERVVLPTVRPPRTSIPDQEFLLNTLGKLWLAGVDIHWGIYHGVDASSEQGDAVRQRIPLPTYPFDHKRYWVEPDVPLARLISGTVGEHQGSLAGMPGGQAGRAAKRNRALKKRDLPETWFYTPSWQRSTEPQLDSLSESTVLLTTPWLIFSLNEAEELTRKGLTAALREQLPAQTVIFEIQAGPDYLRIDNERFVINPYNPADYESLFKELVQIGSFPDRIVDLWSLGEADLNAEALINPERLSFSGQTSHLRGFFSLLNITQAYDKLKINQSLQIDLVTSGAYDVTGDEKLFPGQVSGVALCKVISQEYPNISCRNIDLIFTSMPNQIDSAAQAIIAELMVQPVERFVAYRGRHRWVQTFIPELLRTLTSDQSNRTAPPEAKSDIRKRVSLRQGGVYLVTGGLGRIGLVLAEYLAQKTQAKLALVDRYDFPPRTLWEEWVEDHDPDDPISARIARILAMEAIGAEIMTLQLDVADASALKWAFRLVQDRFGPIDGVIHAAGLVGEVAVKPLAETKEEDVRAQFNPKVIGIQALHDVISSDEIERKPGFVFLQSSLSAVLGGLGLGAYAAANAVMDLLARQYNDENGTVWISVDWDGWQFNQSGDGRPGFGSRQVKDQELTINPSEGVRVFELALEEAALGIRHQIISVADLSARLDQWIVGISQSPGHEGSLIELGEESQALIESGSNAATSSNGSNRPNLQTTYVAPRNNLETQVEQAWEKVLGINPIGVYDDFFELGGHSLLATQLVTRLRDSFQVELPLRRLFESPTIAGLVSLIEEASIPVAPPAAQVSDQLSPELDASRTGSPKIEKAPRSDEMPLSFGQQRLWFLDQLDPGSPLYNNFAALRLSGNLDHEALAFCIQKIVDRHESLRTTFADHNGQPVQVVHPDQKILISTIDLQTELEIETRDKRNAEIARLAAIEANQPFDLLNGPLLRVSLVLVSPKEQIIFLTMHHIVSDGWSVAVLVNEVAALYSAFISKKTGSSEIDPESILPELPIQYIDYAVWQRQQLSGQLLESQINYWRGKLKDAQPLEMLTDYPRPAVQTWHGANRWFEIPDSLTLKLVELSRQEGVTLFMTLLAALQVLLMRYSGQEDITVGTPIANRTRSEAESLIGFILNTLVLRTNCEGNPGFREFLGNVRETALSAYAHQDLPFEMLVEALQPQRDMSRAPFFQVMFDLQFSPLQSLSLPGLTITPFPVDNQTAKFDISLSLEESIQGKQHSLKGYINYNTDLFDDRTMVQFLEHFLVLLESIAAGPDKTIWELDILDANERQLFLTSLSKSKNDHSETQAADSPFDGAALKPLLIHQMIAAQAQQNPDAPAVSLISRPSWSDSSPLVITYRELDQQANQIASHLLNLGVAPETLVGLCMNRSLEMIIGLLGILKAGGAFLPLDPTYPGERLAYMLEDSQAPVILTQPGVLETNPELSKLFSRENLTILEINQDGQVSSEKISRSDYPQQIKYTGQSVLPNPGVFSTVDGENLAYVIYTSGSTGNPKGVMITHAAIAGHTRDMAQHFEISPDDHVLQFASLNFDAGLEQVLTTLTSGAWLFLRDDEIWSASEFQENIERFKLSVVNIPPAYWLPWVQFVAEQESSQQESSLPVSSPTLRLVIIGGDIMPMDSVNLWWQTSLRRIRLLNAYGPTETTITATTYQLPNQETVELSGNHYARVPIGKPHNNRRALVLDQHLGLTPLGAPGELHLGGDYLARGYLNQPELTDEKFVADPNNAGSRLYKTGDLVRWLPDGCLDFIGRVDQQVKLRGFRIEPGEIEAVIASHPAIAECVVVIHTDSAIAGEAGKSLVAYVVMVPNQVFDPGNLFEYTKDRLPAYMVPASFILVGSGTSIRESGAPLIEVLPLTPSGKVDRKALAALPLPDQSESIRQKAIILPRSPLEVEILEMWQDVLGSQTSGRITQISIDDNFFELGGHSLLATQIVSRLRHRYQIDIPLRQLFENPTISGIASSIVQVLGAETFIQDQSESPSEDADDLEALLAELEQMSDDDARNLLLNSPTDSDE